MIVNGTVKGTKRQQAIDDFQEVDSINKFIGNIEAAGEGIDGLQNVCSNMVFIEYPWQPGMYRQATDRLHRMGQTLPVTIWNIVADNTMEVKFVKLLETKAKNFDNIIDGVEDEDETGESGIFKELLMELKEKK